MVKASHGYPAIDKYQKLFFLVRWQFPIICLVSSRVLAERVSGPPKQGQVIRVGGAGEQQLVKVTMPMQQAIAG